MDVHLDKHHLNFSHKIKKLGCLIRIWKSGDYRVQTKCGQKNRHGAHFSYWNF